MSDGKFDVLVVEDKDVIARQLAKCVSENRWLNHAGTAASERAAIDMAGRLRPDLVLLDFGLSAPMGGFDVWRALRELDTVPHVIAVTAAGDMGTVERAQLLGAFRYVVKPFTSATIEAKLADYTTFKRSAMSAPPARRVGQSAIDRLFHQRLRSCSPPSGLLLETLEEIVRILQAAEQPLRACDVADQAKVERGTANRYLTHLCEEGIAERVPEKHGRPGHPAYLYTLAAAWKIPPG
jgi:response regulator of citrate/malate metabolism